MSVVIWLIFGVLAGWISSIIIGNGVAKRPLLQIVLGVVGAISGGLLVRSLGASKLSQFNIWSLAVAVLGSIILILLGRIFISPSK